eukprot:448713-Rhodomonas_salina.1
MDGGREGGGRDLNAEGIGGFGVELAGERGQAHHVAHRTRRPAPPRSLASKLFAGRALAAVVGAVAQAELRDPALVSG